MDLEQLIDDVERHAPDDPLDRLMAAALRQEEMADLADQLLDHFVQAARAAGCSWAQIGEALGVSKQAAQQRHGGGDEALDGLVGWIKRRALGRRRFERFTPRARNAVTEAQAAARSLHHHEIGTEHVLIGLLGDSESVAAKLLARWSIARDDVIATVEARRDRTESPPRGHIPFTSEAKKALELSLREAVALGHNYIGTEHILLGLIHTGDGVTGEIMRAHEVTLTKARKAVEEALGGLAR